MTPTERRERFRAVLASDQLVYPAPVNDPISARIADMLGFEIGFMTPSAHVAAELCAPSDLMVLTSTELAQEVRRITRVSSLSLLVVAENGFGNALNVMRTVEDLENAGAAAVTIYDLVLPLPFGKTSDEADVRVGYPVSDDQLISLDEAVGKMKAALAARQDPSLVIAARTMATQLPRGAMEETIRRVKAYEKAGVDALFVSGLTKLEEVAAINAESKLPLITGRYLPDSIDRKDLAANGLRIASAGSLSLWASVQAVHDTLKALRDGKTQSELRPSVASPELMAEVTRQAEYNDRIRDFLN